MNKNKIVLIFLLSLSACAPKLEHRLFTPPSNSFGPRNQDADLKINLIGIQAIDSKKLASDKDQDTSEFFNSAEGLLTLSAEHPELKNTANILIDHFYDGDSTTSRAQFGKGLYLQAAIGETQADAKDAIFNVVEMLHENVKIIQDTITNSQNDFDWPVGKSSSIVLSILCSSIFDFSKRNGVKKKLIPAFTKP
jgi:hypothetical protein